MPVEHLVTEVIHKLAHPNDGLQLELVAFDDSINSSDGAISEISLSLCGLLVSSIPDHTGDGCELGLDLELLVRNLYDLLHVVHVLV